MSKAKKKKRAFPSYFEFKIFSQGGTQNGLDWITTLETIPVLRGVSYQVSAGPVKKPWVKI